VNPDTFEDEIFKELLKNRIPVYEGGFAGEVYIRKNYKEIYFNVYKNTVRVVERSITGWDKEKEIARFVNPSAERVVRFVVEWLEGEPT